LRHISIIEPEFRSCKGEKNMSLIARIALGMLIQPVMLVIPGLILRAWPPKVINSIYGYRTPRSSQSQEAWDYANRLAGKLLVIVGVVQFLVFALLVWVAYHQPEEIQQKIYDIGMPLSAVLLVLLLVLTIVWVEIDLKKKFG
jgi:uncharacterized membrane protein